MKTKQGWTIPKAIYAAVMMFLLLFYFYVMATNAHAMISGRSFTFPLFFWILRVVSAVMAIIIGKLWRNKGFRILAVFLLLQVLRILFDQPWHLFVDYVCENMLTGLWAICACYGLAAVLGEKQLKQFLTIFASIWTVGMAMSSCLGIVAAWTGQPIYTIGKGSYWGIFDFAGKRLWLTYYTTTSGSLASISTMIALCGAYTAKRKWAKILFILAALPMYVALCLTDSRCAHMSVSAGTALQAGILTMRCLQRKEWTGNKIKTVLPAAAVTAAVFVVLVLISMQTISAFNNLKSEGLISRAYAETAEQAAEQISNRGYMGQNVLTGRIGIWKAAIQSFLDKPLKLLIGSSVCDPMLSINEKIDPSGQVFGHCHNMLLMVLNENGIPGLLLILSLIVMAIRRCWQLVVRDGATAWITPLVAVLGSVMVGELVECFTWFRAGDNATMALFFITIGIILYRDREESRECNQSLSKNENIALE